MTDSITRQHPSFSYPVHSSHTGKLQFRIDGPELVKTSRGDVTRGEVISVRNPDYANGLVDSGQFAHIAADTPVGKMLTDDDHA